jgi:hypothetical protein
MPGLLHSFVWWNNIPLYGYITLYLSIHQLLDIVLFLLGGSYESCY